MEDVNIRQRFPFSFCLCQAVIQFPFLFFSSFCFFFFLQLSYADLSFVEFFNSFGLMLKKQKDDGKPAPDLEELFKKVPLLDGHYKRVLAVPEIKTWVEKRPPSDL